MDEWILKGAMVIDGTGRPPIENGSIRIRGDRIAAVGGEPGDSAGARVVNLPDQVLLPGLIDCHNHVSMDPTQENWPAHLTTATWSRLSGR